MLDAGYSTMLDAGYGAMLDAGHCAMLDTGYNPVLDAGRWMNTLRLLHYQGEQGQVSVLCSFSTD
jgi:hypothetical protein